MRYMVQLFALFLTIILTSGCRNRPDPTEVPAAVVIDTAGVLVEGKSVAGEAFQTLGSNLKRALNEGGVTHALRFCNVKALPLTDSLATRLGVELRRVSHRPRNPGNRADSLELQTIRQYLEQMQEDGELKPAVYTMAGKTVYHAPIIIQGELCLACHRRPGVDITEQNLQVIQQLYPNDQATGYSEGELRGIWTVRFPAGYFDTAAGDE